MGALGLHGITVEEEYGGLGLGYLAHCVAMEEVSGSDIASAPTCSPEMSLGRYFRFCASEPLRVIWLTHCAPAPRSGATATC
jgi:alkylation response protein AidB-like acyl-CoA dehydrogenase